MYKDYVYVLIMLICPVCLHDILDGLRYGNKKMSLVNWDVVHKICHIPDHLKI